MSKLALLNRLANQSIISAWIQRQTNSAFLKKSGITEAKRCLEIGCGQGVGAQLLDDLLSCKEIIVTDIDPEVLALAKSKLKKEEIGRIKLQLANATNLPFRNGTFDLVFSSAVFHHIKDWQKAISEVARVLAPGGKFLLGETYKPAFKNLIVRWFDQPEAIISLSVMLKTLKANNLHLIYIEGNENSIFVNLVAQKQ